MQKSNKGLYSSSLTSFLAAFFVVFCISFGTFSIVQAVLMPDEESSSEVNRTDDKPEQVKEVYSLPDRIVISKIGVDQPVANPQSAEPALLDQNLLSGVVRYPDSGQLGEKKNMFIFGHSTGFKVVQNQAFKAFNRLGELTLGDEILLTSEDEAHIYRVKTSRQVSANEALVEFGPKRTLTLVTCNTFGRKEDRFMVEAEFIRSYKLSQ